MVHKIKLDSCKQHVKQEINLKNKLQSQKFYKNGFPAQNVVNLI